MTDDTVRGTYICAVEAASHEDEAIACPASFILPFPPNEFVRRIRFSLDAGHDGANDDCHEDAPHNSHYAQFLGHG